MVAKFSSTTIFLLTLLLASVLSCSKSEKECTETGNGIAHAIDPNDGSELAILMREMFDEVEQIKKQIANGEPVNSIIDHAKILTAHATQPEKAASAEYRAFASEYLAIIDNLKNAEPVEVSPIYDNLVNSCINCHKAMCPGPLVRIKKLQEPLE